MESHYTIYTYPSWIVSKLLGHIEITHGNEVRIMPISLKNLPCKVGLMSIFLEDGGKPQMPIAIQWDVDEWSYLHPSKKN